MRRRGALQIYRQQLAYPNQEQELGWYGRGLAACPGRYFASWCMKVFFLGAVPKLIHVQRKGPLERPTMWLEPIDSQIRLLEF